MSEVEKLEQLLEHWHYATLTAINIKEIAKEIINAGYLPVQPVQLEVLGDEEILLIRGETESLVKGYWDASEGNFKQMDILDMYFNGDKAISQATIAHNEAKFGKLYRR